MDKAAINRQAEPKALRRLRSAVMPVRVWAAVGLVALLIQVRLYGQWVITGGWRPRSERTAGISNLTAATVLAAETAIVLLAAYTLWTAGRERQARHRIGYDAVILAGWVFTIWQDPLADRAASYNPYALHVAAWQAGLPGFADPHHDSPIVAVLVPGGLGYPAMLGLSIIADELATRLTRRHPHPSPRLRMLVTVVCGLAIMFGAELLLIWTGVYSYSSLSSTGQALSLWGGHWYQLPLPADLVSGLTMITWFAVMRRTDKDGKTPHIFRGLQGHPPTLRSSTMRILAGIGAVNTAVLIWLTTLRLLAISPETVHDLPHYFA